MSLRSSAGALIALALAASACSSASDEVGGTAATSSPDAQETTTSATFRDEPELDSRLTQEFVDASLEEQITDFLENPNSGKGAVIAANMGATGDLRWAPWLLDLHRLAQSTVVDSEAVDALATLSGIEPGGNRTDSFQNYGQWAQSENIDGGVGYRAWKLGLYGLIDDEFAELLSGVSDDVFLSQIHWGGVTRGGIPELNNPARVSVSEADWMVPDELVLGAEVNGEAVAYPVRILGHHELANDVIDGIPVSMVYCTLCRTGLLFDRRITTALGEELVLDFETSGLLRSSNKIMVDTPTDTLWQHLTGTGIAGELEGRVLEQFPVVTTTWSDWVADHPDSETLEIPRPIFFPDTPDRPPISYAYEPGSAYQSYYANPDVWFPILDTPDTFELKASVLGILHDGESLAIEVDALVAAGPQVFVVGGRPVVLVPTASGARAYDGTGLALQQGDELELATDDPESLTLSNVVNGAVLPRIVVEQSFWFAWFGNHQDTAIWPEAD
jgi:hypothetical protein